MFGLPILQILKPQQHIVCSFQHPKIKGTFFEHMSGQGHAKGTKKDYLTLKGQHLGILIKQKFILMLSIGHHNCIILDYNIQSNILENIIQFGTNVHVFKSLTKCLASLVF
jgi:hypothetical protein